MLLNTKSKYNYYSTLVNRTHIQIHTHTDTLKFEDVLSVPIHFWDLRVGVKNRLVIHTNNVNLSNSFLTLYYINDSGLSMCTLSTIVHQVDVVMRWTASVAKAMPHGGKVIRSLPNICQC